MKKKIINQPINLTKSGDFGRFLGGPALLKLPFGVTETPERQDTQREEA
jgi:hypothetical protein